MLSARIDERFGTVEERVENEAGGFPPSANQQERIFRPHSFCGGDTRRTLDVVVVLHLLEDVSVNGRTQWK